MNINDEIFLLHKAWHILLQRPLRSTSMSDADRTMSFTTFYDQQGATLKQCAENCLRKRDIQRIASLALGPQQRTAYRVVSVAQYPGNRATLESHLSDGSDDLLKYLAHLTIAGAVYEISLALSSASMTRSDLPANPAIIAFVKEVGGF